MYTCHICGIKTKHLNGLLSLHWKKHCIDSYSKSQYKRDILANNGRPPVVCRFCNEETEIPKGEKDYPIYHKSCYLTHLSSLKGDNNINYKGGLLSVNCSFCDKELNKHPSHLTRDNKFCSTECSMNFYALPENRTEKQKAHDIKGKQMLEHFKKTDKFKKNHAAAMAKMQKDRKSSVEAIVFEELKKMYPDAEDQYEVDFYVFDILIPSTKQLIEVNGNYWHNRPQSRSMDSRKRTFIRNNRPDYAIHTIWESEVLQTPEQILIDTIFKPVDVFILAGPNGCGKSFLGEQLRDQFEIVDYDKMSFERCLERCKIKTSKPKLLITPIQAKRMMIELRESGIRVWSVYLREDIQVIKDRLIQRDGAVTDTLERRIKRYESLKDKVFEFYGTQKEIKDWLLTNPYF